MSQQVFMDQSILRSPFKETGDFLLRLMENFPFLATVKEITTGKCVLTNKKTLEILKVSEDSILGATADDVDDFMCPHWCKKHLPLIQHADFLVKNKVESFKEKCPSVIKMPGNNIVMRKMVKVPVVGIANTVIGILTYWELSNIRNFLQLFNFYKYFYPNKKEVVELFLTHLHIRQHVIELLTEAEIHVLLSMINNPSHKGVANILNLQPKTIENRVAIIRKKVNLPLGLLLQMIRERQGQNDDVI